MADTPAPRRSFAALEITLPLLITGLSPGTTYVFQARALTKTGYSDWSESVTRIAL